jgi:predicted nucleic acid-binding protein
MITIDASVFISAALPDEAESDQSERFLEFVARQELPVICPTLLIPEVAAAIARRKDDAAAAMELVETLPALLSLTWLALDGESAREAARLAAGHRLRGADAVYVAAAKTHGAVLVTLDREQLNRAKGIVDTQTPAEYMKASTSGRFPTRRKKPDR